MNFPLYIAKRYIRSKSSQSVVNIINLITFLVIVIGSAALFIVLSGFAGLKAFSLSFSNSFDPDLKASPATGKFFTITPEHEKALLEVSGVVLYSKEIQEKVYLSHKKLGHIAEIKGVDENYTKVTGVDSTLIYGKWNIADSRGVAGRGVVDILNLTPDQVRNPLEIIAFKPGKGSISQSNPANLYNTTPMVITAIYSVEEDLDKRYIFANLSLTQAMLEKDSSQISGINFKLAPNANVVQVKNEVEQLFDNKVILQDRREQNSSLHRMLNTENLATYLIFTLVLIIALFNVVGAIIMMILDKQQNSKTLYSLGTTVKDLRRIYFVQGILVTSLGGLIGVILGSLLIWSQLTFGWLKITPSLAYPVAFEFINVLIVMATIIVLGIMASKIASSRVTKKLLA
ncbi:MAG: FtsX-like permease family protein [Flavobacteriaceae bacterium]